MRRAALLASVLALAGCGANGTTLSAKDEAQARALLEKTPPPKNLDDPAHPNLQ